MTVEYGDYPQPCACGGVIHSKKIGQVDEDPNEDDVTTWCEVCGEDWWRAEWGPKRAVTA